MNRLVKTGILTSILLIVQACSEAAKEPATVSSTEEVETPIVAATTSECESKPGIEFLCGVTNPEDIIQLGDSKWLLASGMNGDLTGTTDNGRIHLINHETRAVEILFPGTNPVLEHDTNTFGSCPGPIDVDHFSSHGLALQSQGDDAYRLYMTSHGAREAIEAFEVTMGDKPSIKWIGCVTLPSSSFTNSVAILNDGGFVATKFWDNDAGQFNDVAAGKITGHVFEWHPGGEVKIIENTEMSGANGIAVSADNRWVYVAVFGTRQFARFDRTASPVTKEVIDIGIAPDNLRWTTKGTLTTVGGDPSDCSGEGCEATWSAYEINPETMQAQRLTGATNSDLNGSSTALLVGDEVWVGVYAGDRIGILPAP